MLYHASPVPNLTELSPKISNHMKPLIYFSEKRENVLVYLSNAVEKCCREQNFSHNGIYRKWGSYGFNSDGILILDEYWPNATRETYKGVSGYIYSVPGGIGIACLNEIPFVRTCDKPIPVAGCEYIPDAYEALLTAAAEGRIILTNYKDNSPEKNHWIRETISNEYRNAKGSPEYRFFLKNKFEFIPEE